ncbi:UDP-N-acetylglucosamine--N-acetylmuramyl-(pentapeptide) pyrophosphoryl-undecaprenol N-acetylglucosamine transferase [bacterium]|nr:MAG: UDP-N-acetylglucosamine--N-acetylmuramyl-(pentapeptide) pyrophosphoryl-undecaprenol N-acetylglucosamine transferase [bacterium]
MKLVLTGGGTGGHIYPALEVGRLAAERGAELRYLGSLRGQESKACERLGIPFEGFASEPLWSLKTPAGWRALIRLLRASGGAKRSMRRDRPDVVFSTGGYSAAPVMAAARSLGIPYVIHEGNSIPGRTMRMFAPKATTVCCTFRTTLEHLPNAVRTGHPVRRELREAAQNREETPLVVVVGGSQGARFLNEGVPQAARSLSGLQWLHATGPAQYDAFKDAAKGIEGYELLPYIEADRLSGAYAHAMLAVARSGSTLAEFAAFRLPSVLVPLPTSADDHQRHNALEFVKIGAATLCEQGKDDLAAAIREWTSDESKRLAAQTALAEWDIPDATSRLATIIEEAARKNA